MLLNEPRGMPATVISLIVMGLSGGGSQRLEQKTAVPQNTYGPQHEPNAQQPECRFHHAVATAQIFIHQQNGSQRHQPRRYSV